MPEPKNKSAVHLGNLSAKNRREKMGEEKFKKSMKDLRNIRTQKNALQGSPNELGTTPP